MTNHKPVLPKYDIREYKDRLEPAKEKNKFICPVCEGNDLHIDPKTGAYACYTGNCDPRDIREAIAPLKEAIEAVGGIWHGNKNYQTSRKKKSKVLKKSPKISLSDVPTQVCTYSQPPELPKWQHKIENGVEIDQIDYFYSSTQKIVRKQRRDRSKDKTKDFTYWHFKDGKWLRYKGDGTWLAYGLNEAKKYPVVLDVEGEKDCDSNRQLGIVAIASKNGCVESYKQLKTSGCKLLVIIADSDNAGKTQAEKKHEKANEVGLPSVVINASEIHQLPQDKYDTTDIIEAIKHTLGNDMDDITRQTYIKYLERAIKLEVEEAHKVEEEVNLEEDITEEEKCIRDVNRYLDAKSEREAYLIEQEIRQDRRIRSEKEFTRFLQTFSIGNEKPPLNLLTIEERRRLKQSVSHWLIPGIVPSNGIVLLGGDAGAGKTIFAFDLIGSILEESTFLGEAVNKTGKILAFINDQQSSTSDNYATIRGFDENPNFLLSNTWDTTRFDKLEAKIREHEPVLVLIDSFRSIHTQAEFDENSSEAARTLIKINQLSSKYDVPFLIIHHLNKSGDFRGSTAIKAAVSVACVLTKKSETVKEFKQVKIRGSQPLEITMEVDYENGIHTPTKGNFLDDETRSDIDRVFNFLDANKGIFYEQQEILHQLPGVKKDSLKKVVRRLEQSGKITSRKSRTNKRRNAYGIELDGDNSTTKDNNTTQKHQVSTINLSSNIEEEKLSSSNSGQDNNLTTQPTLGTCPHNTSNVDVARVSNGDNIGDTLGTLGTNGDNNGEPTNLSQFSSSMLEDDVMGTNPGVVPTVSPNLSPNETQSEQGFQASGDNVPNNRDVVRSQEIEQQCSDRSSQEKKYVKEFFKKFKELREQLGWSKDDFKNYFKQEFKCSHFKELKLEQYPELEKKMRELVAQNETKQPALECENSTEVKQDTLFDTSPYEAQDD